MKQNEHVSSWKTVRRAVEIPSIEYKVNASILHTRILHIMYSPKINGLTRGLNARIASKIAGKVGTSTFPACSVP